MAQYNYKAKTPDGRVIDGVVDAANDEDFNAKMRAQKLNTLSFAKQGGFASIFKMGPKVPVAQVSIFSRQFSTMISAGLPVLQALNILCEQAEDKIFKDVLAKVRDDIGSGANLSDAMTKFPGVFDTLYCNMIRAGEISGALDGILDRLSTFLEKAEALRSKIKGAMSYPITILIIAMIIVIFLMVKVVPSFSAVFDSFGGDLPAPTKLLLGISAFEQKYALYQIGAIVLFVIVFNIAKKTEKAGFVIDGLILKAPIFGPLTKKSTVARFARTLGTLLKSGVGILDALEIVARASGNRVIEKAIMDTRAAVREGQNLSDPLKATGIFPNMVLQMVSVGEETGKLDDMLLRMSDFYEAEVDTAVESIMSMIEPLIMSVLGVTIGFIVIAMFMPMMAMGGMVG